jgi:TonB family protein
VNAVIVLSVIVRPNGLPGDIKVVRPAGFGLDAKAIEAVQQWRFNPGSKSGQAVAVQAQTELSFRIQMEGPPQTEALSFPVPDEQRPILIKGEVPHAPHNLTGDRLRIHITVNDHGKPEDLRVLETSNPQWAESAMHKMREWRFQMPSTTSVEGEFEVIVGRPKPAGAATTTPQTGKGPL